MFFYLANKIKRNEMKEITCIFLQKLTCLPFLFSDFKMAAGRLEDEDMATCVSVTMGVLGLLLAIFGISSLGLGLTAGWFYIFHENAGYAYIPLWGGCVVSIETYRCLSSFSLGYNLVG